VQPDLFAERPIIVFGKWRGARRGDLVVTGRTGAGPFSRTIHVADVDPRANNGALPRLWARTRIARLSDFNFDGNPEGAVREVTSLGLTYSLLTAHTSFIAVLEEVRNTAGPAKEVQQPLPLPQGVSDLAVGGSYASGAEPELWLLTLVAAAMMAVVLGRRRALAGRGRR
jgi:Ca-activated chloride channel family protein